IWSEALKSFSTTPSVAWNGRWITVIGLLDAPFHSAKYNYTHISMTIEHASQINFIDEKDAEYRLGSRGKTAPKRNETIISKIRRNIPGTYSGNVGVGKPSAPAGTKPSVSSNQKILAKILKQQTQSGSPQTSTSQQVLQPKKWRHQPTKQRRPSTS